MLVSGKYKRSLGKLGGGVSQTELISDVQWIKPGNQWETTKFIKDL